MGKLFNIWPVLLLTLTIPIQQGSLPTFIEYIPRRYSIDAVFYPQNLTLDVKLRFHYLNDKAENFTKLYFHFFPNSAYFHKYGGKVDQITIYKGKKKLNYRFKKDGSVLEVDLGKELNLFERLDLTISFRLIIPGVRGRYGYYNGVFAFGNWYPILAVYDERGWNLYPYLVYGESFYSEAASYDVKISVPSDLLVAATGELVEKYVQGDRVVYHWRVELARDFAWVASKNYVVKDAIYSLSDGEVKISVYLLKEYEEYYKDVLTFAFNALKVYSHLFGPYPYSSFKLCQVFGDFAGMEYPGLVMISDSAFSSKELLELVVAHEAAHQWWYNVVGNDQASEPWLDESLAEYSQFLYFEHVYGVEKFREVYRRYLLSPYYSSLAEGLATPRSSVWDFKSEEEYVKMVYLRGAATLHMLRLLVGDRVFLDSLREYYSSFYFKIATTEDLRLIFEEVGKRDLDWFFEQWLKRSDTPSLELIRVEAVWNGHAYTLKLYIRQFNVSSPYRLYVPLKMLINGKEKVVLVEINDFEEEILLSIDNLPIIVILDPEDDILGKDYESYKAPELISAYSYDLFMFIFFVTLLVLITLAGRKILRRRGASHAS